MKVGEILSLSNTLTNENMVYLKQLGVNHLTVYLGAGRNEPDGKDPLSRLKDGVCYDAEALVALRKWVESHGLELSGINSVISPWWDKILLGQPGRDEQIEEWNQSLRNMAAAGIYELQYACMINAGCWMPIWRTSAENVGRGGTRIVRFDYAVAQKAPLTSYGEISDEILWDNLTYFLKAVIPVAEKAGVKMLMHPCDPQVPTLAGIARIVRSVETFDRLMKIIHSSANSMTFCLGCFAQMMEAESVYKAIRHFGKEGHIGRVHFRGVRGTLEKFNEVFPDEGKVDMLQAVKVLKEVGFKEIIEVDHGPHPTCDTEYGHISHAFQIGYLKGILQGADALE